MPEELSPEEKKRRRAEAEAAFQAWLERKKEEHKERKRHMAGSKSLQVVFFYLISPLYSICGSPFHAMSPWVGGT